MSNFYPMLGSSFNANLQLTMKDFRLNSKPITTNRFTKIPSSTKGSTVFLLKNRVSPWEKTTRALPDTKTHVARSTSTITTNIAQVSDEVRHPPCSLPYMWLRQPQNGDGAKTRRVLCGLKYCCNASRNEDPRCDPVQPIGSSNCTS